MPVSDPDSSREPTRTHNPTAMERTEGFAKKDFPLPALKVELWQGFVFVHFDPDAAPLAPTLEAYLAAKLRLYRCQGVDLKRRYWFPVVGYNYRMTNIQAAIGLAQMETIDSALQDRRALARVDPRRRLVAR